MTRKSLISWLGLVIVLLAAAGFFTWDLWREDMEINGPDGQTVTGQDMENNVRAFKAWENDMRQDTYGGKTPKETLDMFVEALRKGDTDLAFKYFIIEFDTGERDAERLKGLQAVKNEGNLTFMADDITRAEEYKNLYEGNQQFVVYNKDKTDSLIIDLELNTYSNVWKIVSF